MADTACATDDRACIVSRAVLRDRSYHGAKVVGDAGDSGRMRRCGVNSEDGRGTTGTVTFSTRDIRGADVQRINTVAQSGFGLDRPFSIRPDDGRANDCGDIQVQLDDVAWMPCAE